MIRFFVRQPVLVNMLLLSLLVAGVLLYRANIKEQMPEVPINAVAVSTIYPGVSAGDMEKLVTQPIEDEIRGLEGIDYFNSRSKEGSSFIWVEFKSDIESMTKAVVDLQNRVDQVTDLPADAEKPRVYQARVRHRVLAVAITGRSDVAEKVLRQVALRLKEKLEDLTDTGEVQISGIRERRVDVQVRPERLKAHGVTLAQVIAALRTRSRDVPGGNLQFGPREYALRALVELRSVDEIERIVVRPDPRGGRHVTVGDLSHVRLGFAEAMTRARSDGQPAVILTLRKEQGGDILRLSRQAHRLIERFSRSLPAGVSLKAYGDGALEVKRGLGTLYSNGLIGMLLVLAILWFAIGSRNAVLAALGIPTALLGAGVAMYVMDISVSIVSLFALILCVGIVVDDAIVIIENVYRHLELGKRPRRAAIDGTREVMWPVISSVLTTVAAFLPLLIMVGIMGKFFSIIPKVVAVALAASLVEALIILPSHMADFGRVRPQTRLQRLAGRFGRVTDLYVALLRRALSRPLLVSFGAVAVAIGLVVATFATKEVVLLGDEDAQRFDVRVEMPRGVTLERTMAVLRRIEARALELPRDEVTGVVTQAGWSRTRLWPVRDKHRGMVTVYLKHTRERERRCTEILAQLRRRLRGITGPVSLELVPVTFGPPKGMPVAIRVSGDSFPRLKQLSEKVQAELRKVPHTVSVTDDFKPGKREVRVKVQPERAALHGLNHESVALFIRAAYGGFDATRYRYLDEELDVVVRYGAAIRNDPDRLESIEIGTPLGGRVPLLQVARIESGRGPSVIRHWDGKRTIKVTADVVEGRTTSSAVNRAMQRRLVGLMAANPEVKFAFGGEWEKTAESLESLFRAFLIAALLIFTILSAQFRSFAQPLVVILAIPLSLTGVVVGFFVSGEPVGMIALIGVVGLAGIAVNDATILVDFINKRRAAQRAAAVQGQGGGAGRGVPSRRPRDNTELRAAILEAGRLRIRPVFLTTLTTVAGLLPLALGWGGASESLKPMALAIVWGLSFCTVLTLVVVPCLYVCVDWLAAHVIPGFIRAAVNRHDDDEY
jgi:multidrug efflux pump subunit AcrB